MNDKSIFNEARQIDSPVERAAYLKRVCDGDENAIDRIQGLLDANDVAASFLESPPDAIGEINTTNLHAKQRNDRIGDRIGPYKLLQQIGEGGMGTVFMAEQQEPVTRRVALKLIKPGMDSKQVIARFEAERQALALMDHPNIARLLDVGMTDSELPYFVMELVKGIPITQYCDEKRLSIKQRLELFGAVCKAVQHAHQKGIIHRDLKPNNVLVAEYDDRIVPKIIDFGLAKALTQSLTERTMFTHLGQVVGTLTYMSPEQSKMNQLDVDTRTDIYSLGVMLYELLTGSTPFEPQRMKSAALDQILKMIREEEPPKPSTRISSAQTARSVANSRSTESQKLNFLVRGDLDWIVMKAIEKDRARRYETANGLASDIQRHLDGNPTLAAPPSSRYRFKKFVKRNRVAVAVTAIVSVALLLGVIGATTGLAWSIKAKNRADRLATSERKAKLTAVENANKAIREKNASRYSQYVSNIQAASAYDDNKSTVLARNILQKTPAEFRNWEWAYLANNSWRLNAPVKRIVGATEHKTNADYWRSGKPTVEKDIVPTGYIAGMSDGDFIGSSDEVVVTLSTGGLGIFNLDGSTPPRYVRVEDQVVWYSTPSPDGQRLVVESVSGWTGVWDVASERFLVTRLSQDMATSFNYFWGPDQQFIYSIHNDHTLRAWNSGTLDAAGVATNTSDKQFSDVYFEPRGQGVVTASLNGEIRRWPLPLGSGESELLGRAPITDKLDYQVIAPNGKAVIAGFEDGSCFLWDISSSKVLFELSEANDSRQPTSRNYSAAFSSDASCVAVVTDLIDVTIYDVEQGTAICELSDHAAFIRTVTFSHDNNRVMTVSEDGLAKIWQIKSPASNDRRTFENAHDDIIFQIAIDPAGRKLLTGSFDRTARVWDLNHEKLLATYEGHEAEIVAVDISDNGALASTLDSLGNLHVWNANDGTAIFAIDPQSDEFSKLIRQAGAGIRREVLNFPAPMSTGLFSPDGSCVVLYQGESMKVFNAETGNQKFALDGANNCGWPIFSHDSSMVSVLDMNARTAGVWSLDNGNLVSNLDFGRSSLSMLDFSPINNRITGGGMNGRTVIWDAHSGEVVHELKRESSFITGCHFSPLGEYLLTGDGSLAAVWDVETGKLTTTLGGHTARIRDVRISPDGSRFVSWGMDDKVIVWDFQKPVATPLMAITGHSTLLQVKWTPNGKDLITSWADGKIIIYKGASMKQLEKLELEGNEFKSEFDRWRNRNMILNSDH